MSNHDKLPKVGHVAELLRRAEINKWAQPSKRLTWFHEAGHAVVAYANRIAVEAVVVAEDGEGYTRVPDEPEHLFTEYTLELLGGGAAEVLQPENGGISGTTEAFEALDRCGDNSLDLSELIDMVDATVAHHRAVVEAIVAEFEATDPALALFEPDGTMRMMRRLDGATVAGLWAAHASAEPMTIPPPRF
ncbi:MAG TPA: hypothetical protein PLS46_00465 [Microthrixaceae bacterium]|nr:hypothetical protein [Microthrixaceae bacterium]